MTGLASEWPGIGRYPTLVCRLGRIADPKQCVAERFPAELCELLSIQALRIEPARNRRHYYAFFNRSQVQEFSIRSLWMSAALEQPIISRTRLATVDAGECFSTLLVLKARTTILCPSRKHRRFSPGLRRSTVRSERSWQRPQAELKPAAFAFRRLGCGRLGLHDRIIRRPGQPEQGIVATLTLAIRLSPHDLRIDSQEESVSRRSRSALVRDRDGRPWMSERCGRGRSRGHVPFESRWQNANAFGRLSGSLVCAHRCRG